jgi:hypothetical protein
MCTLRVLVVLTVSTSVCLPARAEKPAAKFPIGKETTYITGPIDTDGYIIYETVLNERLGKGITPEKNANVLLWKALGPTPDNNKRMPAEYFRLMGMTEPPKEGDYFINYQAFLRNHLKLDSSEVSELYIHQDRAGERPWTVKEKPQMAAWLKANEKPLAVVKEATGRPQYFNPLVSRRSETGQRDIFGVILPNVMACRQVTAALTARSMLRVADGKFEEAWEDLLTSHRLARLIAQNGGTIETLMGAALESVTAKADLAYLESARLTSREIQGRLKDLQTLPPLPALADKVDLAERFTYLETMQLVRTGSPGMLGVLSGKLILVNPKAPDADTLKALALMDWEPGLRNGNHWCDRMVAALRIKDRTSRQKEIDRIYEDLTSLPEEIDTAELVKRVLKEPADKTASKAIADVLIRVQLRAVCNLQKAQDRTEQIQRNVHVAFALAAYRRDNGRYPAKLELLAPKYLATVPGDLFSGKELIYRPTDEGYLFYSVGVNGKDDGGRSYGDEPPGDDLRVRMPIPQPKPKK